MKTKTRKSAYPGDLGTPMAPIYFGLLDAQGKETAAAERAAETMRRMELLAQHLGYGPEASNRWLMVALSLAQAHVPGLTIDDPNKPKAGAEKIWDSMRRGLLVFEMRREIDSGLAIKQAAYKLSTRRPWTKLVKGSDRPEALRAMYTRSKNRGDLKFPLQLFEVASKAYLNNGDEAAWLRAQEVVEQRDYKFFV